MAKQQPDYKDVTVTCRAPRAVISFDASANWESRAAVIIAAMGKYWGGSQFILVPHVDGKIDPALLRLASIHDPDHVFEFNFSDDELAKCAGTYQAHVEELHPALQMRRVYTSRPPDSLFEATSVYRMELVDRRPPTGSVFMTSDHMGPITLLTDMPGGHNNGVYQAVPKECGGSIGLAMALRAGFVEPPTLPFVMDPSFALDPKDLGYALGRDNPTRQILTATGGLAVANPEPSAVPVSWTRTEPGIGKVYFSPEILRPSIAVVGTTAEDFCLAFALDRMTGHVLWLPDDLLAGQENSGPIEFSIFSFLDGAYQRNSESVITSVSWPKEALDQLVEARFSRNYIVATDPPQIHYVPPTAVANGSPCLLACMPSDFGIQLTLPIIDDKAGGIDLTESIPVHVPACSSLAPKGMPFWEVDVTVDATVTPMGRNSPHKTLEGDPGHFGITTARSSQAGVSFHAQSQGLILSGQPLRHAIARPKLRFPNLLDWVQSRCTPDGHFASALPSDAGRRAMIAADLYGGRDDLAKGLQVHGQFFREFLPPIAKKGVPYPEDDGFFIKDLEGSVLSFRAAMRVLHPDLDTPENRVDVRGQLDTMLTRSILRRGLVLRCYACRRVSFFAVDAVGRRNRCTRCDSKSPLIQTAWITRKDEPEWFYDLHPSVGGLISGNGDVPIMAGRYLAGLSRRGFADVPELDFVSPRRPKPDEIDLIAHVNQQVLVGEAKCMDHLGDGVQKRKDAAAKFIRVAKFLHADQIVLVSSGTDQWKKTSVDTLVDAVEHSTWDFGPAPRIRLITGIGTDSIADLDVLGQPWKEVRS